MRTYQEIVCENIWAEYKDPKYAVGAFKFKNFDNLSLIANVIKQEMFCVDGRLDENLEFNHHQYFEQLKHGDTRYSMRFDRLELDKSIFYWKNGSIKTTEDWTVSDQGDCFKHSFHHITFNQKGKVKSTAYKEWFKPKPGFKNDLCENEIDITYTDPDKKIIINQSFYKNSKLHNENGPAYLRYRRDGSVKAKAYWLNGKHYPTVKEYEEVLKTM